MPGIAGERREVAPPAINTRFEPGDIGLGQLGAAQQPEPGDGAVALLLLGALAIYLWPGLGGALTDADTARPPRPCGAAEAR
ncbi:MAG: hypothetical protein QM777_22125 [Pseudorhodoferax sp.]